MTDEEKLLRFAGFTEVDLPMYCHDAATDGDSWYIQPVTIRPYWAKDNISYRERPDTTDLAWLFKWCVPKLKHWNLQLCSAGVSCCVVPLGGDIRHYKEAIADTPGEALRGAILALVEAQ